MRLLSPRTFALAVSTSVLALAFPLPASAATNTATETITAGSLTFIGGSPTAVAFPSTTLNGTDQTATQTQTLDITDARGSGAGWNVTATSTQFNNGSVSLAAGSTQVTSAPSVACDVSVSCVIPTNSVTYPFTLPAGATAPVAQKLYNAATSTGTGGLTVTPTWKLAVPATSATGTYNSTWTLSLISGP